MAAKPERNRQPAPRAGETTMVRVSRRTHAVLRELAEADGTTISGMIDRLATDASRKAFFAGAASEYQGLRADAGAWARHEGELAAWDAVLADGLDPRDAGADVGGNPRGAPGDGALPRAS